MNYHITILNKPHYIFNYTDNLEHAMTTQEKIEFLLEKQRSTKIKIGVTIGLILIVYFFSYGGLIDKAPPGFMYFQLITSTIMFTMLFMLNRISFKLLNRKYSKDSEYTDVVKQLTQTDVDEKIKTVVERFENA